MTYELKIYFFPSMQILACLLSSVELKASEINGVDKKGFLKHFVILKYLFIFVVFPAIF